MILRGMLKAKASYQVKIDGKVRKLGYRKRLDTSLFLTVNDTNWMLVVILVSMLTR